MVTRTAVLYIRGESLGIWQLNHESLSAPLLISRQLHREPIADILYIMLAVRMHA